MRPQAVSSTQAVLMSVVLWLVMVHSCKTAHSGNCQTSNSAWLVDECLKFQSVKCLWWTSLLYFLDDSTSWTGGVRTARGFALLASSKPSYLLWRRIDISYSLKLNNILTREHANKNMNGNAGFICTGVTCRWFAQVSLAIRHRPILD